MKSKNWSYAKPAGGQSSPYRLDDFRGYDSEAELFFKTGFENDYMVELRPPFLERSLAPFVFFETPQGGGIGLNEMLDSINNNLVYAFVGIDNKDEWFVKKAPLSDRYNLTVTSEELEFPPYKGVFAFVTNDFILSGSKNNMLPNSGTMYPIPHNEFYNPGTKGVGNFVKLSYIDQPLKFAFTVIGISKTLQGAYLNTFQFNQSSNPFYTSDYGDVYVKLYHGGDYPASIRMSELSMKTKNTFMGIPSLGGGVVSIYDHNFNKITSQTHTIEPNQNIYIGGERFMNAGFTDIPSNNVIKTNITIEYMNTATKVSSVDIYMKSGFYGSN